MSAKPLLISKSEPGLPRVPPFSLQCNVEFVNDNSLLYSHTLSFVTIQSLFIIRYFTVTLYLSLQTLLQLSFESYHSRMFAYSHRDVRGLPVGIEWVP